MKKNPRKESKMKKISITTKTGDQGKTGLFSGERVSKYSPRLEAYGDLDELVSVLSIARHHVQSDDMKKEILALQQTLFIAASELATTPAKLQKLPRRIDEQLLKAFDEKRQALEDQVEIPQGFVIPGNTLASAYLDFARTIARRCERKIVHLLEEKTIANGRLVIWFNRLSDYLYLLARFEEKKPLLVKDLP